MNGCSNRFTEPGMGERLGVVTSVALLGSLPVLSVFLVFSDLQPPWGKLFTAAAGIFALSIVSIYTTILFRKSREFYDRHELIIVPASMYIFLIATFNYAMSLQSVPPPEGVSWGDLFIVIYSVIAIPLGVKLLCQRTEPFLIKKLGQRMSSSLPAKCSSSFCRTDP